MHEFLSIFSAEGIHRLIQWGGLGAVCLVIFAETGFFAILPGDSMLVLCGMVAAPTAGGEAPILSLWSLLVLVPLCAVAGDQVGFWLGSWFGVKFYKWKDRSLAGIPVYKQAWLRKTQDFAQRWGVFSLVAGRWVPIVRTFAPIVAGIGKMRFGTFISFNAIGGISWVWSMVLLGYFLGAWAETHGFPLQKHIDKVAIIVVLLSVLPIVYTVWKEKQAAPAKLKPKSKKKARV